MSTANLLSFAYFITAMRLSGMTSFIVMSKYTLTTKVCLVLILVCITVMSLVDSDSMYKAIIFVDSKWLLLDYYHCSKCYKTWVFWHALPHKCKVLVDIL